MNTCIKKENNKHMNQILVTKLKKNHKKFFKIQLVTSIIIMIGLSVYYFVKQREEASLEEISVILEKNIEISQMYNAKQQSIEKSLYLGRIRIEKINTDYPVLNEFNEELLKIAPCKFYGGNIGESGNICIAGHNYNDSRFFGRLDEIVLKDEIKLIDLTGKEHTYIVFDIFETDETNVNSVIRKRKARELTLLTCNNSNKKRIIIKAFLKE